MSAPDTSKLDTMAETYIEADARTKALTAQVAAAKTATEVAFAVLHGAAAEHAALHGGRARAIREAAVERAWARLASVPVDLSKP